MQLRLWCLMGLALTWTPGAQAEDGTLGEWHFDAGTGDEAKDSSGEGHDGKILGATWTEGREGKALQFKGPGYPEPYRDQTFVTVPGSEELNPEGRVDVSAWVYPTAYPTLWGGIVEKGEGFGSSYRLLLLRDGRVRATIGNEHLTVDSPSPMELESWTQVRFLFDGEQLQLFLNGESAGSAEANPKSLRSSQPIQFGGRFTGKLDDIRIVYGQAPS